MNRSDDLTPRLRSWLKEPVSLREDGAGRVGQAVHLTPQQHGPLPPRQTIMSARWFAFASGAGLAAFTLVIGGLLLLSLVGRGDIDPAPAAPSASPSPSSGPPQWPGVAFEPIVDECPDGCDWAEGGVWSVSTEHHGDLGSTGTIAFGPDLAPWFLGDGFVWRLDSPDEHRIGWDLGNDLAVADDGTVWVASANGLHAFDGEAWTQPFTGTGLEHLDVAPDGTVVALDGGWTRASEGQMVVTVSPDGSIVVDRIDVLPEGVLPVDIMATPNGRLWVSAIASGYWPIAIGESLLAYSDGDGWVIDRSLGPDVSVAAGGFARAPDGSVWATLSTLPDEGELATHVAQHDGESWTILESDDVSAPYWVGPSIGPDGTVWFPGPDVGDNVPGGIVALGEEGPTRYLAGTEMTTLAVGPDGTAFATTLGGFDEEGQLVAIRH